MMSDPYAGLEPAALWRHFAALNGIPRPSGKEAAARDYVLHVAREYGADARVDARGNAVVSVPASPGFEGAAPVAVQSHLDMVCEKRPDVQHDFDRDPIRPRREGDRIYAAGTTLGADNGIGAAAALALLTEPGLKRGPLELIFTVEEETGLHGAMALDPTLVRSRLLINLDSEDPRELTVGCAGGAGTVLKLPLRLEAAPAGWAGRKLVVSGLKGGHSGVQIHERLANAIKLLNDLLLALQAAGSDLRLRSLRGGNAHNAIPRDASALLAIPPVSLPAVERAVAAHGDALRRVWGNDEPGVRVELREAPPPERVMTELLQARLLALLDRLPHGVLRMSEAFPGKVETSSNLAQVETRDDRVEIGTSSRSFVEAEIDRVQAAIRAAGETAGAEVAARDGYPGWEPDPGSRLLRVARKVYEREFGVRPEVEVIHAGLECGVIVSRVPGMEAISFGPSIKSPHTPEEHVYPATVESTWRLLTALLAELAAIP
jgi:dipeptidase D